MSVIPPPSAVVSVGVSTVPNSMFLSSICNVVELRVVVVPFTVKSPVISTLPATVVSPFVPFITNLFKSVPNLNEPAWLICNL